MHEAMHDIGLVRTCGIQYIWAIGTIIHSTRASIQDQYEGSSCFHLHQYVDPPTGLIHTGEQLACRYPQKVDTDRWQRTTTG